jgi:hypothetical protein
VLNGGVLPLLSPEAVEAGGASCRNGGKEAVGTGKVAAAAVRRRSAWPGRLCLDRVIDRWVPRGF